jgi:hypothetical protein
MRPLPSIILANEDQLIWLEVSERFARGGDRYNLAVWVRADDRRDAVLMLTLTRARRGLKTLKKGVQEMYGLLTPREREVMEAVFGRRRQE